MRIYKRFKIEYPKFNYLLIIFFGLLFITPKSKAQKFSPSVKQFISVDNDTLALVHVSVIDGTGNAARTDQTIIVIKGRFYRIGKTGSIEIPSSAKVIDGTGKTIIPGMIMMHEHMFYGEYVAPFYTGREMPITFPRLYLAGGATTIRTGGTTEPATDLNIKHWIDSGEMTGPDIDVTGPYIERKGIPIPEMLFIHNTEEAIKEVNYWADMGCTSFKAYMNITKPDLAAVVSEAHKRKLKVTGHLCSITFKEAADLGIDNLEHGFFVSSDFDTSKKENECNEDGQYNSIKDLDEHSPLIKELMAYLIKKNVAITSTLPVFEPYTSREIFPGDAGEALTQQVKEKIEKRVKSRTGKDSIDVSMFKKEMAWEKQFVEMGGRLMAGIDPTGDGRVIPGYADRHVPELLMEAGFSLTEAIKICTMNAAEYLGREKEIGSIEEGKRADFVLINGDVQKNIKAIRNTEIVFKNGIGFDSKKIFESVKGLVGLY